jgi:glycosyltransferase involved in cell wall biosynthesis
VPTLRRAGAETQVIDLVNGLSAKAYRKYLVVFDDDVEQLDRVDQSETQFLHLPRKKKVDDDVLRELGRLIDDERIDIVHCTLQISLFMGRRALRHCRRRPQFVTAIHTTKNVSLKNELFDRILYSFMLARCRSIIFVCQAQADYWGKKYPWLQAKSEVVYNGVDTDYFNPALDDAAGHTFRQRQGLPADAFVIACIAGFRPEKGHNLLVEAFAGLDSRCHLLLAGDGPLRKDIERRVADAGLGDRVHFLGNVADVRPLLSASNLSVLSSTAVETFSIAMLESMAMEVPVVASDVGGLREAVIPGTSGRIVPIADVKALREAIRAYIADDRALLELGRKARVLTCERFSVNQMVARTSEVLGNVNHATSVGRSESRSLDIQGSAGD